jgi:penicillin-binding protein 2
MKPHLVKILEDGGTKQRTLTVAKESGRIPLKQENIDVIKRAMVGVINDNSGTGFMAFRNAGYLAGGKTGTAQVVGLKGAKYNHNMTPERMRDNALFTAFAPADKPKIAIAMVVENAGFGAQYAAPIARKALDYYLLGKRPGDKAKPVPSVAVQKEDLAVPEESFGPNAGLPKPPGGETPGNKE